MSWADIPVPFTIRRPWRVFEEDLQDKIASAQSEGEQVAAVLARGAQVAFTELPQELQQTYTDVSLMELAAYMLWQNSHSENKGDWDLLDSDTKADWVPDDPRTVITSDPLFAPLAFVKTASARAVIKKPAKPQGAPQSFAFYSKPVKAFESRGAAFEALGMNVCCQSHAARVVKKVGNSTFLRCRLRSSTPPCLWAALLVEDVEVGVELRQHPLQFTAHELNSAPQGKIGFPSLEERKTASAQALQRNSWKTLQMKNLRRRMGEHPRKETTPVGMAATGNKPRAAVRRSVPLKADEETKSRSHQKKVKKPSKKVKKKPSKKVKS